MRALFLVDPGFLTASFKMGVPREPGAAGRVGKGGDSEHSRKNGKRWMRLPFLSRAERSPTWCGRWDLNPHVYGWTQAPQACLSTYSSTPASGSLDAALL